MKNHENEILDDDYVISRICQPWPQKEESGPSYQYNIEVANASKLIVLILKKDVYKQRVKKMTTKISQKTEVEIWDVRTFFKPILKFWPKGFWKSDRKFQTVRAFCCRY